MSSSGRRYRAGESVPDNCRACKAQRQHTVMVVDGIGRVLRVVCDYCGSQHNYRGGGNPPARGAAAERRPTTSPFRPTPGAAPRLAGATPTSSAPSPARLGPLGGSPRALTPDREPPPSRGGPPPAVVPEPVVFPRATPATPTWSAPRWPSAAPRETRAPGATAVAPASVAIAGTAAMPPAERLEDADATRGPATDRGVPLVPAPDGAADDGAVEAWAPRETSEDALAAPSHGTASREPFPLVSARERTGAPMSTSELDADVELLLRRVIREELGLTSVVPADRWRGGELVLRPGNPQLQEKRWPIETFFHKIVMIRNRLRMLEQQINATDLPEDVKVRVQTYVTGCYGSLTSFNLLFADEHEHFKGSGGD